MPGRQRIPRIRLLRVGHLALGHLLHQLAHLAELLDEAVDRLDGGPRAGGDPLAARAVDLGRVGALVGRHREDDRLEPVELALVDLPHPLHRLAHPGHHLHQVAERAHAADLLHLGEEVLERELLLADLPLEVRGLVRVELVLGLLDQRHDVAHAEDAARHPVGVEALELVELLAGRGVDDRLAGHGADRERGAAARVAVELGDHDAVEVGDLGEALGDVDRVLAGHRVDDEQHVVGLGHLADPGELVHQLLVDVQAAGGVDDQHVAVLAATACSRAQLADLDRVGLARLGVDVGLGLRAELLELLDRGGPLQVAGGEGDVRCPAWPAASRASRRRSSCPSPAGRPSGSRSGRSGAKARSRPAPPISSVSSSLTALTTVWPGLSASEISSPASRSRSAAVKSLTTLKLTSASSSASRTSRRALSTSSSESLPRERTSREHALEAL